MKRHTTQGTGDKEQQTLDTGHKEQDKRQHILHTRHMKRQQTQGKGNQTQDHQDTRQKNSTRMKTQKTRFKAS